MSTVPLMSIGLPVYNGMTHLRAAIESLLAQSYPNLEIIISDNASDDGTSEYCRALARVHPHVYYARNGTNVGPVENFRLVLSRARGEYFMWAAHDDKWGPEFAAALVERLETKADAVLATPAVIHIREDGTLCSEPPDRPATGRSQRANLELLYEDHAASWIYGVWRTAWLRQHFAEYCRLPYWGADVLWLADICLSAPVVGNQDAVIFKRKRRSGFAPRSARDTVVFWASMFWHLSRISIRRNQTFRDRATTLALSWNYVYRLGIRRPYPLRTAWRVVRMFSIAAITSLPLAAVYAWRRVARKILPTRAL
jgi:glycosyltransferase involved in cell wall biosynthesis